MKAENQALAPLPRPNLQLQHTRRCNTVLEVRQRDKRDSHGHSTIETAIAARHDVWCTHQVCRGRGYAEGTLTAMPGDSTDNISHL